MSYTTLYARRAATLLFLKYTTGGGDVGLYDNFARTASLTSLQVSTASVLLFIYFLSCCHWRTVIKHDLYGNWCREI